ncbi:DUF3298 domain-containing protein [Cohnella sp. CFH 77786]|uniref:DUF3298 and DUF4163 domain-containing protein n=1 Tax=Cohnella sp. CFH 77786 TaxID=2662265 RepID=UPI001C6100A7|nr:DUF3298 and DUF4163 domain-containing protein [Cohnella sp. CFH 77786]MBW5447469.1 DUF3298 domain-containing protein [Cohnella sp. CFH 77786]
MNRNTLMLPMEVRPFTAPNIKINTPVVAGGTTPQARNEMNREIVNVVHAEMKTQGYPSPYIREMNGSFEIKTNERGVLSLSLINYTYSGGAHGNTLQHSLTFDADTGKRYALRELFKLGSRYEERLNAIIQAQIAARKLPILGPYPGLSPDQDFYIADKALVIYFPLYALVPYAWGFPYFPISVYELQEILDENGPLGIMLS